MNKVEKPLKLPATIENFIQFFINDLLMLALSILVKFDVALIM